jgi:uncharacterized RDD family membrane protein YckC
MFCTQCGTPSDAGLIFCKHCGNALLPPVALTQAHEQPQSAVPQVRPGVRFWARTFDLSLFTVVVGLVFGALFPSAFSERSSELVLNMIILFSWVFVESFLLSVFGTTPGKALFKTRLLLSGSDSIPFVFAFYRSLKVWWRGLGAGFLIITWITLLHADTVLSRDSITSWDKELGFVVVHKKIGATRVVIAVIWFAMFFALTIVGSVMKV